MHEVVQSRANFTNKQERRQAPMIYRLSWRMLESLFKQGFRYRTSRR